MKSERQCHYSQKVCFCAQQFDRAKAALLPEKVRDSVWFSSVNRGLRGIFLQNIMFIRCHTDDELHKQVRPRGRELRSP